MNTCLNEVVLLSNNYQIWNLDEVVKFLVDHQNEHISIDLQNEGFCLSSVGFYDLLDNFSFKSVTIDTNNLLEHSEKYNINITKPFICFKTEYFERYADVSYWNKKYKFGCFYNRPLWHRIGLAAEMQTDYSDSCLLNVRCDNKDEDNRKLFEVDRLFTYSLDSFNKFSKVVSTWPIQVEETDGYTMNNNTNGHTDQLLKWYPDFLIDLVCETWTVGRTFLLSEKTVRPMLLKKPMIVMGPRCTLEYLRQMGFETFSDFWSEDYDGYSEKDRYLKILELIKDLDQLPIEELDHMYQKMQPILEHNLNLLKTQSYKKHITYIED